jgi:DNA mismatch endonuclease (patch repair protein)
MADIWDKRKRSDVMSRIPSRGNKDTELRLIHIFRATHSSGWRRNQKLPGKPDVVYRMSRVAARIRQCVDTQLETWQ